MIEEYSKNLKDEILDKFVESESIISKSKNLLDEINICVFKIINSLQLGKKIILFGNGGSAADAQHMAAEFVGRYLLERASIPAISLTTDTSIITAIANDYDFNKIFSRQCEALLSPKDIVIAISTSGNSQNVLEGVKTAKKKGAYVISLTGKSGGLISKYSDLMIKSPSNKTPLIQESQRVIIHIICELTEKYLNQKSNLN